MVVFLIFLVLGVEAEGFVIPTGSMAPTLMGRHKEAVCPECGATSTVDASREVESASTQAGTARVVRGTCSNCLFPLPLADSPNNQGDRVYVLKTPLRLPFAPALGVARPGRWDVAVFKLPEDPEVRYIKRQVGLPDETLRIHRGDIWVRPTAEAAEVHSPGDASDSDEREGFRRALRPLPHQDAMQVPVFNDAHRPKSLAGDPRWTRWTSRGPGRWTESTPGHYRPTGGGADWAELRYRHVAPDPAQWAEVASGRPPTGPVRPTLIGDFCAYNTDRTVDARGVLHPSPKPWQKPHWVGDLTLSLRLDVRKAAGSVRLELVKAGVPYRAEVDLAADRATLYQGDQALSTATAVGMARPGSHDLRFSNVDDRLTLRVDGRLPLGDGLSYRPTELAPQALDLDPVGVGSLGADVGVSALVLSRDIYYSLYPVHSDFEEAAAGPDTALPLLSGPLSPEEWLADPAHLRGFAGLPARDFPIRPGHYLMLGDNSPWSRDGRAWNRTDQLTPDRGGWDSSGRESWEVPENLVIGKALCVYWPHLRPVWPALHFGKDLVLPLRPGFERMRWIR